VYAKIFTSLFEGSMRGQPDLILVFLNLLCNCDENGVVDRHWRAVADETGLTHENVKVAINALESPDPESRTPTDQGRRIVRLDGHRDWGWMIVNYSYYRKLASREQSKTKTRERVRVYRAKRSCNAPVTIGNDSPSASSSTSSSSSSSKKGDSKGGKLPFNSPEFKQAWDEWAQHRKEIKKKLTPTTITKQLKQIEKWGEARSIQSIETSILNGWQGLFEHNDNTRKGNGNDQHKRNGQSNGEYPEDITIPVL